MHDRFLMNTLRLVWLTALTPVAALCATFGDPRGFLDNETVTETVLHPGVVWLEVTATHLGTPQVIQIVTVDIAEPHLGVKSLLGQRFVSAPNQFFRRSIVSQLQADNNALVAINTAFFDINATQAPRGIVLQDKVLYAEPESGRTAFVFTESGQPGIGNFNFLGAVRQGLSQRTLAGINHNTHTSGQLYLYMQPWDRSPGTSAAFMSGITVTEVVLEKTGFEPAADSGMMSILTGRVVAIRDNMASTPIAANQFVLTGSGAARVTLLQMPVDATVEVAWRLTGGITGIAWNEITEASAGSSLLVSNGIRQTSSIMSASHWNDRHPRSAVGINADGTRMLLMLVEGRQAGRAAGMSLHTVGEYMLHLQARNALEFDGGGSSSIVARVAGAGKRLNSLPDGQGTERYVPAGLGIVLVDEPENPFFRDIRVTPGPAAAVLSWETAAPATTQVRYGHARLDRTSPRSEGQDIRHSAMLTGLDNGAICYARIEATTATGREVSQLLTFHVQDPDEVIIDDAAATFAGAWNTGAFGNPWGAAYRWANTVTGNPTHTATFAPNLTESGRFDVYVWYVPGSNRPTDAGYEILHADGLTELTVDQTTGGEQWRLLAADLPFAAGAGHHVRVHNRSTVAAKAVMADAVRWVRRGGGASVPGEPPDWWLRHFFGAAAPAGATDADGDGSSVYAEFLWGTDPTNPHSRLRQRIAWAPEQHWQIIFAPFLDGRNYVAQTSGSPGGDNWQDAAAAGPAAEPGAGMFLLPHDALRPGTFFRIAVQDP